MKMASVIARYLLGLIFLVFGLNGFLRFIPMPPPKGLAAQFGDAIFASHYWVVVFGLQVLGGLLLLLNRFVVLALVLLGPIIVNIFFFHMLMAPEGIPLACRGGVVADSCGALQAISGGDFCAARGVKASLGEKTALPSPPLWLAGLSPIPRRELHRTYGTDTTFANGCCVLFWNLASAS